MNHLEAIVEIKKIINPNFIKKIIPLIKLKSKNYLKVNSGIKKQVRNVKGYHLNFETPTNIFYWNYIKTEIERLYDYYKINQIDLLKYSVGGRYEVHTDHYTNSPRHLSIIMNLNDNYEGGDLIFTAQNKEEIKRLKLSEGSIVFFPSNFMYPHSIEPITKGTRYSIVAWLQ